MCNKKKGRNERGKKTKEGVEKKGKRRNEMVQGEEEKEEKHKREQTSVERERERKKKDTMIISFLFGLSLTRAVIFAEWT